MMATLVNTRGMHDVRRYPFLALLLNNRWSHVIVDLVRWWNKDQRNTFFSCDVCESMGMYVYVWTYVYVLTCVYVWTYMCVCVSEPLTNAK